jgi:hypothetical protein
MTAQRPTDGEAERRKTLLERAEQIAASIGTWEFDPDDRELLWSDNLFRIMGLAPGAVTPTLAYVIEHALPDDQERVERHCRRLGTDEGLRSLDYRRSTETTLLGHG